MRRRKSILRGTTGETVVKGGGYCYGPNEPPPPVNRNADPEFGSWQAAELQVNLEKILSHMAVSVKNKKNKYFLNSL